MICPVHGIQHSWHFAYVCESCGNVFYKKQERSPCCDADLVGKHLCKQDIKINPAKEIHCYMELEGAEEQ